MKNILFAILILTALSCEESNSPEKLTLLNLEKLEKFAPLDLLEESSKAIFKNENHDELQLDIISTTKIETGSINDISYEFELRSFTLRDLQNSDYFLNMALSSQYDDLNTSSSYLRCSLTTNSNGGWKPSIVIDESGNSLFQPSSDLTLGTTDFTDVFSSLDVGDANFKYSKIYYNFELGFVGFHDANNELWYLDRYEK